MSFVYRTGGKGSLPAVPKPLPPPGPDAKRARRIDAPSEDAPRALPIYPRDAPFPTPIGATLPALIAAVLDGRVAAVEGALAEHGALGAAFADAVRAVARSVGETSAALTEAQQPQRNPKNVALAARKAMLAKDLAALTSELDQWRSEAVRLDAVEAGLARAGEGAEGGGGCVDAAMLERLLAGTGESSENTMSTLMDDVNNITTAMRQAATHLTALEAGRVAASKELHAEAAAEVGAGAGVGVSARSLLQGLAAQAHEGAGRIMSPRRLLSTIGHKR